MDSIDKQILWELQQDGRLSNQDLADRVGLSPSPCLRRVRQLEEAGVITGYSAHISPKHIGLNVTAFVRLTMNDHSANVVAEIEERIRAISHIIEAYLLSGGTDYLLKVMVADLDEFEKVIRNDIRTLPAIASIETSFAFGMPKPNTVVLA